MSESVQLLVERLHAKRSGDGWKAKCPVHDDREPSISIREGSDGRALIKCHAGCQTNDILAAIDLKPRDLFVSGENDSEPSKRTLSRKTNDQNPQQFDWQECVTALKLKDLVRLGNERWWSRAFCVWLHDEKKIGLYKGHFAFPVERDGKIVAAKYKWGPVQMIGAFILRNREQPVLSWATRKGQRTFICTSPSGTSAVWLIEPTGSGMLITMPLLPLLVPETRN